VLHLRNKLSSSAPDPRPLPSQERIKNLNDFHTYAVYKYTSRGLFERHKLLLSLQMCTKILQTVNQLNVEEFQFFMRGGSVLDHSAQPSNPDRSWMSEEAWDNITELDDLQNFKGIASSLEGAVSEWEAWYRNPTPETAELPGAQPHEPACARKVP